jgi:OFA family oxalate/formate antiporter-like MFS transporter
MSVQPRSDVSAKRWPLLVACAAAMLAIANLQYGWTLFTTPLIESLGANLAAVQLASTLFVITQTGLFRSTLSWERSSARIVVSLASCWLA